MSPADALLQMLLLIILFCGVMPLLGGGLLYKIFSVYNVDHASLSKCMTAFFGATGVAYLLMMFLRGWLPEIGSVAGVVLCGLLVVLVEVTLIGVMLKKFTVSTFFIEAGAVILTNLLGYSLVLFAVCA